MKNRMKYYGTKLCPDCVAADQVLEEKGIGFEFIDITSSTKNLKEFLRLRDAREEFETARQKGFIGIPCFVRDDESIIFEPEAL